MSTAKANKKDQQPKVKIQPGHTKNPSYRLKIVISCLVLMCLIFFVFRSSFDNQFVNWDDQVYVEEQPLVLNHDYAGLWKTPVSLNYHPVTMISLAMQTPKDFKKLSPAPFIKLNVWLHIFNCLLVFIFIWMISDRKWLVAFITAAIFGLHPMHVESVVWVSERKDVLYTFFFLLSCIFYWQYLKTDQKKWIITSGLFFVLSVLSKAMAVTVPVVWFLLDYWKGRKLTEPKVILEKIPFLAFSLFFGLMAVSVQSGGDFGGVLSLYGEKSKAVADAEVFTLWQRCQFATYGFINYLLQFFYPVRICAFYPYPENDLLTGAKGIIYPFAFITVSGLTLWSSIKTRIFAFGVGFYFVTVALVLQFMAVGLAVMADRYTYIPYIGLAFMFVYVADDWVSEKSVLIKYAALGIAAFFITLLTIKSIKQVEVWHDSESLWTQVLQYYPKEDLALANRGNYRGKTGNIQGAMADFETAIADGCHRADVYEGLGNSYGTMSEQLPDKKQAYVSKAIEMYQNALAIEPTKGNIQYNLGVAQMQTNPAASEIAFTEALRLMPYKEKDILPVLGLSQVNAGKYNEAIRTLSRVIDSGQGTDILYYHRGLANLGAGNKDAARADFTQSLKINPQNQEVRQRLATM